MGYLRLFNKRWNEVPAVMLDVETTGKLPGADGVVQLGIARFESAKLVSQESYLVNPGQPIPEEATGIHGITDEMVKDAPTLAQIFEQPRVQRLLDGAQPGAFNEPFDRAFMPPGVFDRDWPWLDPMIYMRVHDKYGARGKGNGTLEAAAARHGIKLEKAHDAGADAVAAGELMYLLIGFGDLTSMRMATLGQLLEFTAKARASDWFRFARWCAEKQGF